MTLLRLPDTFSPITKHHIRTQFGIKASNELCGVASVAMLLSWCGTPRSFEDVYCRMLDSHAYVEGQGTYLKRVAELFSGLHYIRYMPFSLVRLLLAHGYCMAVSIMKPDGGSHIVFVCGMDAKRIYYYDPNKGATLKNMTFREWKRRSNRRAVAMKVVG